MLCEHGQLLIPSLSGHIGQSKSGPELRLLSFVYYIWRVQPRNHGRFNS